MGDSTNIVNEPPHFSYIWTIQNMCDHLFEYSPTFTVKEMELTKWYLRIDTRYSEFISLVIGREDNGPNSIEIKLDISFLGKDGLPLIEKGCVYRFTNDDYFEFNEFVDFSTVFFQRTTDFLPKDSLTIRCRMWRIGTEIAKQEMCYARTLLRQDRPSFVWAIKEFSTLQRDQPKKIVLNLDSKKQLTFTLVVKENNEREYLNMYIEELFHFRTIEICLLDFEGKVIHSVEGDKFEKFFFKGRLMNKKESLLPNDVLTLRCEVEMWAEPVWSVIENYRYFKSMSLGENTTDAGEIFCYEQNENSVVSSFTEAMKNLIKEGTLSDVSLRTDSKLFPAHKCILSARSPVFKAMFSGEMKEKTSKCVEIPDINEDTLGQLLSYIYTDTVGKLEWRGATDLYRAADKYELLDLMKRCAAFLKSNLSVTNVCTVLCVADLHHDKQLQEAAQDFVMRQEAEFFKSDMWREFKEEHSKFACDIMEWIVCSMKGHH